MAGTSRDRTDCGSFPAMWNLVTCQSFVVQVTVHRSKLSAGFDNLATD